MTVDLTGSELRLCQGLRNVGALQSRAGPAARGLVVGEAGECNEELAKY